MKIYVDDCAVNKRVEKGIKQAVRFFAQNERLPLITVVVVTVADYRKHKETKGAFGFTSQLGKKGLYLVTISRKVANGLAKGHRVSWVTIFHEMQHVKQFQKGELYYAGKKSDTFWKGVNIEHVSYRNNPSEIEAEKVGQEYADDFMAVYYDPQLTKLRK